MEMKRFFADEMVGKLAGLLRAAGYDTLYERAIDDTDLAIRANRENRVVLTCHKVFADKTGYGRVVLLGSRNTFDQIVQVARECSLDLTSRALERCTLCNALFVPADKEANRHRIPPKVWTLTDTYYKCPVCDHIYWQGTHAESMIRMLREAQEFARHTS